MKFSRHQAIREALLESEDGMTLEQLAERFDLPVQVTGKDY
jgi:hypothetical protein